MTSTNEWHINTGTVPEGVGSDTVIEVEYRDGGTMTRDLMASSPLWAILSDKNDIIRWRFV